MKYKGYTAIAEFDAEDRIFVGRVMDTCDVIAFDGQTVDELENLFKTVVDDYLADCQRVGKPPDRPCSGRFNLRIAPELHRKAYLQAQIEGISLNTLVERVLTEAL